ncbi:MAG: signal peptidase I [bacterium]
MTGEYVRVDPTALSMSSADYARLMVATLEKGALFRFTAPGFSMSPFIRDGAVLTIASAPERIRFGDVVAFVRPQCHKLVVHRVVGISQAGYLIKGDNAPEPDACVMRASIIGRVVRVEHGGKRMRLGLGMERIVFAFLSRRGWLTPVLWVGWRALRPFAKGWKA